MCGSVTTKTRNVILDLDMVSKNITFEDKLRRNFQFRVGNYMRQLKGRFGKEKHQNLGVKVKVVSDMVSGNT